MFLSLDMFIELLGTMRTAQCLVILLKLNLGLILIVTDNH